MKKQTKQQVELLKKYIISDYTIEKDAITINGGLDLRALQAIPDSDFLKGTTINGWLGLNALQTVPDSDFLKGTTINGWLGLNALQTVPDSDFLKGTTINGWLDLNALQTVPDSDFLKGTTINGWLGLNALQTVPDSDFLKGATINGGLDLNALQTIDKEALQNNIRKLTTGYNKKQGYCFFDGILSKVLSVKKKGIQTIYQTPFGFICEQGSFTAHGKTLHKASEDLKFKVIAEKLKHEPIKANTMISRQYYHVITGACDTGIELWVNQMGLADKQEIRADELLPILKKSNAYGTQKFESLIKI